MAAARAKVKTFFIISISNLFIQIYVTRFHFGAAVLEVRHRRHRFIFI